MDNLHHELTVLSRAVGFKNISTAAENIGLSQPQISRIIARVENELGINLLDRGSRRNATWTKTAKHLSEVYKQSMLSLNKDIEQMVCQQSPKYIRVACLEGLIPYAKYLCHQLLCNSNLEKLEINVFDLSILEERFVHKKIDLALTSRTPGRRKYNKAMLVGYQSFKNLGQGQDIEVMSTFEQNMQSAKLFKKKNPEGKTLVSNSLELRKQWLQKYGGKGIVPSPIEFKQDPNREQTPVYLIAQEDFHSDLWQETLNVKMEDVK